MLLHPRFSVRQPFTDRQYIDCLSHDLEKRLKKLWFVSHRINSIQLLAQKKSSERTYQVKVTCQDHQGEEWQIVYRTTISSWGENLQVFSWKPL